MTTIVALLIIGGVVLYFAMPKYIVYALNDSEDEPIWEEAYKSVSHDKAKERYLYLNEHKEDGVKYYIFVDEETGNSIIPF